MATKYKGPGEISEAHHFHHGLVMLLVLHALQKNWQSWDQFLQFEGFKVFDCEQESSAMPTCASSSQKGKEKVMSRDPRTYDSLIFSSGLPPTIENEPKDEGLDAPLEPIRHLVPMQSLVQA